METERSSSTQVGRASRARCARYAVPSKPVCPSAGVRVRVSARRPSGRHGQRIGRGIAGPGLPWASLRPFCPVLQSRSDSAHGGVARRSGSRTVFRGMLLIGSIAAQALRSPARSPASARTATQRWQPGNEGEKTE